MSECTIDAARSFADQHWGVKYDAVLLDAVNVGGALSGNIFLDRRGRFCDGERVRTSSVRRDNKGLAPIRLTRSGTRYLVQMHDATTPAAPQGDGVAPNWLDSLNEPIVAKVYGENGIETVALTVGTDISEGRIEYEVRGWSDKCGERHKAGWFCSRAYDHTGACAMWPVSHDARMSEMLATPARQSRADSFMESLTNIAIGLAVSQVANLIVLPLVFHVPVSNGQALALGLIYTAISLVRSYALRRAFNGRSVWQAIKGHWA